MSRQLRGVGIGAVVVALAILTACVPARDEVEDKPTPSPSSVAIAPGRADFDGDGFGDLAVRKTDQSYGLRDWGGSLGLVQVLYGTATGFHFDKVQQWARADLVPGAEQEPDAFGFALVHGDFDGDGYSDLVIGDPGATEQGSGRGSVHVLFGSAAGLTAKRLQTWTLDTPGVGERSALGDGFGYALAVGNLGRGSEVDLAIGAPGRRGAGEVLVVFGASSGLAADGHQVWRQGENGLTGKPQRDDSFGAALTTGDFDGDAVDELVIGVRYDTVGGTTGAGSVHVLRGTADGPTAEGSQHWVLGQDGLGGKPAETDLFGDNFAVGRFSDSGHLDLAIGMPGWNSPDGTGGAGAVEVLYGTANGLSARGNQFWNEYLVGTREPAAEGDPPEDSPGFGSTLAAADFGRGQQDDLVIGVPEALTPGWASGAIQVLYGTPTGLTKTGTQQISEVTKGINGYDDDEALFGTELTVLGPLAPRTYPTLGVSAPWYGGRDEADRSGMIHLIHGSADGLTADDDATVRAKQLPPRPVGESFGSVMTS